MDSRTWIKLKLAIACMAALGMLAALAGTASAEYTYLCPGPALCGSIGLPFGLAVDNSSGTTSGDVYVVSLEGTVRRFNAFGGTESFTGLNTNISGNTLGGFAESVGVGVDSATGDFYVSSRPGGGNALEKFSSSGEPLGSFTIPGFEEDTNVAVDNSGGPSNGDVYVGDAKSNKIDKIDFETQEVKLQFGGTSAHPLNGPYGVAVDPHGHVYVANFNSGTVFKFSESGTFEAVVNESGAQAVAVDPSTEHIFVVEGGGTQILPYEANLTALTAFGAGTLGGFSAGLGVNGVNHFVYASDLANNRAAMYGEGVAPSEAPATEGATGTTANTAILHGKLNPGGAESELEYHFIYNTGGVCTGGGSTTAHFIAHAKEVAVESEATGLSPATEYTACLVASNPFGSTTGSPAPFTTQAGPPVIAAPQSASSIGTESAQVEATINPSGAETTCKVKYGPTASYGEEAACSAPIPAGSTGVPVAVHLENLEAGKTYHFQFVATNSVGTTETTSPPEDATFTTKPKAEPTTEVPNPIGPETATLKGQVKNGAEPSKYYFAWGKEGEKLPNKTPEVEIEANKTEAVSAAIAGLSPGTTYEVQLIALAGGVTKVEGAVLKFTTLVPPPTIVNKEATGIGRTTATVVAEINPEGCSTEYDVEYGETTAYEKGSTPLTHLAAKGEVSVPLGEGELKPETTYHYRFVATNCTGTTEGEDATFTTSARQLPSVEGETSAQVTQTTATVSATVKPNGLTSVFAFELGTETAPGVISYAPQRFGNVSAEAEAETLTFALSSLQPGTTYHFRVVMTNADGTVAGADATFTTTSFPALILPPAPVPIIPVPNIEEKKVHVPTRHELYVHAVALCKKKPKHKRAACMRQAKRKYGPVTKKKSKKK